MQIYNPSTGGKSSELGKQSVNDQNHHNERNHQSNEKQENLQTFQTIKSTIAIITVESKPTNNPIQNRTQNDNLFDYTFDNYT